VNDKCCSTRLTWGSFVVFLSAASQGKESVRLCQAENTPVIVESLESLGITELDKYNFLKMHLT
jgi:hypothetical protein